MQAKALDVLSRYSAEDIMNADLATADSEEIVHYLMNRGGRHFIFFVSDADERVVGVVTEKEAIALGEDVRRQTTVLQAMRRTEDVETVGPKETGATMLQTMETASLWHLPVVDEGRVVGVVSKESLLRLLAQNFLPRRTGLAGSR
jgi:CBS domain-containing protein